MHVRGPAIIRRHEEDGASLIEYALMLALIAIVTFSAVAFFGGNGDGLMQNNADCVGSAMAGQTC